MTKVDRYFTVWALVLPITSVLLLPSVQGTTPGYLLALAAPVFALIVRDDGGASVLRGIGGFFLAFLGLSAMSQLAHLLAGPVDLAGLPLIDDISADGSAFLRSSLFTQALYLLAGVSTLFFVRSYYSPKWDRYLIGGALLLAVYGLYEVGYFLVFRSNGDFLSNRVFTSGGKSHSGSLFQVLRAGPIAIQRLKSLTGEPSMYAFTVLPFWIYTLHSRRTVVPVVLLATLLLTMSTTAVIGLAVYLVVRVYFRGLFDRFTFLTGAFAAAMLLAGWSIAAALWNQVVLSKLTLASYSAATRFRLFESTLEFFRDAPFAFKLFGVGFGYVRSTDMFSTLLVNNGILGFILVTCAFAYPVVKLGGGERENGLKASLIVIYVTMMVAVPEYAYLTVWVFLGMAYHELARSDTPATVGEGTSEWQS